MLQLYIVSNKVLPEKYGKVLKLYFYTENPHFEQFLYLL